MCVSGKKVGIGFGHVDLLCQVPFEGKVILSFITYQLGAIGRIYEDENLENPKKPLALDLANCLEILSIWRSREFPIWAYSNAIKRPWNKRPPLKHDHQISAPP